MKFIAIALLCIGAVAAASHHPGGELIEALEKRASALQIYVKKVIADHRAEHAHLLVALEHQSAALEALLLNLKHHLADHNSLHIVHVIEEDLLYVENRIAEELIALEHAKPDPSKPTTTPDPNNPHHGGTLAELIARAEKLLHDGKAVIVKHPRAREVGEIERELIIVEALIRSLHQKPAGTPAELKKEQQELARQEKSLQQLIDKVNARKP